MAIFFYDGMSLKATDLQVQEAGQRLIAKARDDQGCVSEVIAHLPSAAELQVLRASGGDHVDILYHRHQIPTGVCDILTVSSFAVAPQPGLERPTYPASTPPLPIVRVRMRKSLLDVLIALHGDKTHAAARILDIDDEVFWKMLETGGRGYSSVKGVSLYAYRWETDFSGGLIPLTPRLGYNTDDAPDYHFVLERADTTGLYRTGGVFVAREEAFELVRKATSAGPDGVAALEAAIAEFCADEPREMHPLHRELTAAYEAHLAARAAA